jgi:hypothetical protein
MNHLCSVSIAHSAWVAEQGAKNYLEYGLVMDELDRVKFTAGDADAAKAR